MVANAQAVADKKKQIDTTLDGKPYQANAFPYQAKVMCVCLSVRNQSLYVYMSVCVSLILFASVYFLASFCVSCS